MTPTSDQRFDWAFAATVAATLVVGLAVSVIRGESAVGTAVAAVVCAAWLGTVQVVPWPQRRVAWIGEGLSVAGAFAALLAVGVTGGVDSPYLLFSITPTIFASSLLGRRVGVEVAALATLGLVLVAQAGDMPLLSGGLLIAGVIQFAVAIGFSQVVDNLDAARRASAAAQLAEAAMEAELSRLQAAHDLLLRLTLVADVAELSPVKAGREAIDNLADAVPFDSCLVALAGEDGPVVVARRGTEIHQHHRTTFPLTISGREVGFVALSRGEDFTDEERAFVHQALRPLGLAFSNMTMLQDLARRAVLEERTRLARALHDEIGPSLASVGLGLDVALMQFAPDEQFSRHLKALREAVSRLVEEIRTTVADLRYQGRSSLVQHIRAVLAEAVPAGMQLVVELDERRPPRPSISADLAALITEALRNAIRHSEADRIVVDGFVDHASGSVAVRDDGVGFDPGGVAGRHYGLIGMAERAEAAGLSLKVDSTPGAGTVVSIAWGTP